MEQAVGIIIIGDELLSGKRRDRHFAHVVETVTPLGLEVAWCRLLGDVPALLTENLRQTFAEGRPVFCFGGIGATPDDVTRRCAADAGAVTLERHPEAVAEIEAQFGADAYPTRVRMAELPAGSELIPNPYNRIPGFTFRDHHFLPGFPQLAWPMLEWVLQRYFPGRQAPLQERGVIVEGRGESHLVPLLERLGADYPQVRFASLPKLTTPPCIELGVRGRGEVLDAAFDALLAALKEDGFSFRADSG